MQDPCQTENTNTEAEDTNTETDPHTQTHKQLRNHKHRYTNKLAENTGGARAKPGEPQQRHRGRVIDPLTGLPWHTQPTDFVSEEPLVKSTSHLPWLNRINEEQTVDLLKLAHSDDSLLCQTGVEGYPWYTSQEETKARLHFLLTNRQAYDATQFGLGKRSHFSVILEIGRRARPLEEIYVPPVHVQEQKRKREQETHRIIRPTTNLPWHSAPTDWNTDVAELAEGERQSHASHLPRLSADEQKELITLAQLDTTLLKNNVPADRPPSLSAEEHRAHLHFQHTNTTPWSENEVGKGERTLFSVLTELYHRGKPLSKLD